MRPLNVSCCQWLYIDYQMILFGRGGKTMEFPIQSYIYIMTAPFVNVLHISTLQAVTFAALLCQQPPLFVKHSFVSMSKKMFKNSTYVVRYLVIQ